MAKNISKVIKRIITIVCALAVLISMIPTENIAYASTKVGKTSKITFPKYSTLDGAPYYKYNKAADPSILGDVGSCEMKWKKVAGADGYKIRVLWLVDGTDKQTDTFYVVKKEKKYVIKDKSMGHGYWGIGKWKTLRDYEGNPYKSRLYSKKMSKLQLVMLGGTSEEPIKVSIQAYKNVNGKKVYGEKVSKKVKYYM